MIRFCKTCRKSFDSIGKEQFCSESCRIKSKRISSKNYKQNNKHYYQKEKAICKICGKEFLKITPRQVNCSHECYLVAGQRLRAKIYRNMNGK